MKKVVVDIGANVGQGFNKLKKKYPLDNYDYILIEPNPYCVQKLKENINSELDKVQILEKAIWTENTKIGFYGHESNWHITDSKTLNSSQGNSIIPEHNNLFYSSSNNIEVETLDILDLINNLKNDYSSIILKIDAESAEYSILERLIENYDNVGSFIEKIYVEFHSRFYQEEQRTTYESMEKLFIDFFNNKNTEFFTDW